MFGTKAYTSETQRICGTLGHTDGAYSIVQAGPLCEPGMRRLVGTKDDMKYEGLVEFLYQHVRVLPSSKMAGNIPKSTKFRFAANTAAYSSSPSASPLSCSHNHVLRNCPVFLGMDVRLRPEFVTQKRLCWNCLDSVHQAKKWSSKFTCRT